MTSRFTLAKNAFIDSISIDECIDLPSFLLTSKQLEYSMTKSLNMILLLGNPGVGKSMLLNRLENKLRDDKEIYYLSPSENDEISFLNKIFKILTKKELPENANVNFVALLDFCRNLQDPEKIIILLDKAEAYSISFMEKIQAISETQVIQFIVSLSENEDKSIINNSYFKSRIWEVIELKNLNSDELKTYIDKKLSDESLIEIKNSLNNKNIKLIYRLTKGNFRACNLLMYTLFEICEYYNKAVSQKFIEMAALKLGYLHV